MTDLIIINVPDIVYPNSFYGDIDYLFKNRTLKKYSETQTVYLTHNRKVFLELKNRGFKTELSFLDGESNNSTVEPFLSLISSVYILKKINLDDIRNIAILNNIYLLIKDLEDLDLDLDNSIKFDNDNIIYGGKMPILILSSIFHDKFLQEKKIDFDSMQNILNSLNINLEEKKIAHLYA